MRIIVTGGAGFIGSTVVDELIENGDDVHVVDDFSHGRSTNLAAPSGGFRCTVHRLDVRSEELLELVRRVGPEVVIHLAAQIDVRASVTDPLADARLNVLGTLNVAEAARYAGARKVVFASSGGSIHGEPEQLPVDERAPLCPESPYAAAKIAGETYLDTYRRLHGLDCTHLALANVYGPRQDPHGEAGVVAIFASALLDGRPTTLFGDGGNTRDYVFVGDVARAFRAASGERGSGRRFNIGTGVQTTDRRLHELVAEAAGVASRPDTAPARSGDVRASALDATAAVAGLGWKPEVSLRDGIARTVDHFRGNAEWRYGVA